MEMRPLGASGIDVSVLALGSWRTYERIPRDQAVSVMRVARDVGICFLDDARYNDETGAAPIPTGYSEVVFGEVFRAVGWDRDDVVVANKLWWEFWPDQPAAEELGSSLGRMRLDHVDLIYTMPPPDGLELADLVGQVTGLIRTGMARAWGIGNWPASLLAQAVAICQAEGWPLPCAAQLPYSLVGRDWVEAPEMAGLLGSGDTGLVASYALAGGVLSGKYLRGGSGRASDGEPNDGRAAEVARALDELAGEWECPAAQLALAFVLAHPHLSSLLFGATTPEQVAENVGALEVARALDADELERLQAIGT
jgi:aryl-alcohol dehydrogenase-like predicted oxidoreductase